MSAGGDSIRFPYSVNAPVTLHALWAENPPSGESGGGTGSNVPGGGTIATFTITYDANGASSGTIPTAQTKLAGKNMALATNRGGLSKIGYTFAGWNTQRDGAGTKYVPGSFYGGDSNLHLYALWIPNTYTVTFNSNDGSGAVQSQTFTYDVAQGLSSNSFVRVGYDFDGWATQADGGDTSYGDGQTVSNLTAAAGGSFTLSGATISGNKATSGDGAGVYVASGASFTVTSGTIGGSGTGNTAGSGGGIYNSGTVNLEGGTVSSNTASQGNGIYQNGTLNMKGTASVSSRLYLPQGKKVNLTGSLTGSASTLHLEYTNTTSNQVLTGSYSDILGSYGKFTVDNSSSYGIDNEGYLRRYVKIDNPSNLQSNITSLLAAASDGDTVTIDLVIQPLYAQTYSGDNRKFLMIIEETSKSLNIVINGNGRTADAFGREDSQGGVLRINAPNSTVTLKDITLKGGHFGDQWGGAIALQSGTLIIEDGTKIAENVSWGQHGYGGGICAWGTSKIYMRGGGVYVTDQASMKITGGTVNDESTGKSGLWGDCLSDRSYIGTGNYAEASGKVFCQYQPEGSGHQITSTVTSGGSPTVRCHQDKSAYNVTINMQ